MTRRKRHLMVAERRAACGVVNPPYTTRDPQRVTCGGCQRTVAMADAEISITRRQNIRPVD